MTLAAHVVLRRGSFHLDVELAAPAGQVLAVVGPNGAGKSTLLRALAGLIPLDGGRVELAGQLLEDGATGYRMAARNRRVGVVFQDYRLFPHLSARENVAFGPRSTGTAKAAGRRQADAWLERLGLPGLESRRPAQLSGGQAQRVALARALCGQPRLLLLDEPLAALDVGTRTQVRSQLAAELDAFAGPALLVTHDPLDAMALADRLLVVEAGRVAQEGPPAQIAQRPATDYAARLVGLNLVRGTATAGVLHCASGGRLRTADATLAGPALAVVRPSAVLISLTEPGPSSARNVWPGRLAALEIVGDRVRVSVASTPPLLAEITTEAMAELRLRAGDSVWVSVKATDIATYPDPIAGARLAPAEADR